MKTCMCCGDHHPVIPSHARPWIEDESLIGWVWECKCKNTLFQVSAAASDAIKAKLKGLNSSQASELMNRKVS